MQRTDRGGTSREAAIRTEPGPYYDDLQVGDVFEHRPGRTISEADNTWFSLLTMNPQPLHIDAEYSSCTAGSSPALIALAAVPC
jgi:itaconyl-CoA hydratase